MLFSDNLSKSDNEKIKKLSVELLKMIKGRIAGMDHWTDKQETRATVGVLIRSRYLTTCLTDWMSTDGICRSTSIHTTKQKNSIGIRDCIENSWE